MKRITKTGIFWGSFDPPTLAHKAIIIEMLKTFYEVLIIVNDHAKRDYFAALEHRINMLHSMLTPFANRYKILLQNDRYINNYINLQQQVTGDLCVVVGMDALQTWLEYHDIAALTNYDGIYVVPRSFEVTELVGSNHNVFTLPIDLNYQYISSSKIRNELLVGQKNAESIGLDTNVLAYIKQHGLYGLTHRL